MPKDDDEVVICRESFATQIRGRDYIATAKRTKVKRSDPLYLARPSAWEPLDLEANATGRA